MMGIRIVLEHAELTLETHISNTKNAAVLRALAPLVEALIAAPPPKAGSGEALERKDTDT